MMRLWSCGQPPSDASSRPVTPAGVVHKSTGLALPNHLRHCASAACSRSPEPAPGDIAAPQPPRASSTASARLSPTCSPPRSSRPEHDGTLAAEKRYPRRSRHRQPSIGQLADPIRSLPPSQRPQAITEDGCSPSIRGFSPPLTGSEGAQQSLNVHHPITVWTMTSSPDPSDDKRKMSPPRLLRPDERALVADWLAAAGDISLAYVSSRSG